MILITSAVGDHSRQDAAALAESFVRHGWPRLIVLSETAIHDLACENIVASNGGVWRGRGLKTGFADAIPADYHGPVAWIDVDCIAIGPYIDPHVAPNQVLGLSASRYYDSDNKIRYILRSTVLVFGTADLARKISARWRSILQPDRTDEPALWQSISWEVDCAPLPGTHEHPLPNLWHDGRNSRVVNGRAPAGFVGSTIELNSVIHNA